MLGAYRILIAGFVAAALLLGLPGTRGFAQEEDGRRFQCVFSGAVAEASAEAVFRVGERGESLHYTVKVRNLDNITMAHLHLGTVGEFGTPVAWLYPPSPPPKLVQGEFSGVLAEGTITEKDLLGPMRDASLADLIRHMERGHTYANIHTEEHPRGEICGPVRFVGHRGQTAAPARESETNASREGDGNP
jgi:hypothetical protein